MNAPTLPSHHIFLADKVVNQPTINNSACESPNPTLSSVAQLTTLRDNKSTSDSTRPDRSATPSQSQPEQFTQEASLPGLSQLRSPLKNSSHRVPSTQASPSAQFHHQGGSPAATPSATATATALAPSPSLRSTNTSPPSPSPTFERVIASQLEKEQRQHHQQQQHQQQQQQQQGQQQQQSSMGVDIKSNININNGGSSGVAILSSHQDHQFFGNGFMNPKVNAMEVDFEAPNNLESSFKTEEDLDEGSDNGEDGNDGNDLQDQDQDAPDYDDTMDEESEVSLSTRTPSSSSISKIIKDDDISNNDNDNGGLSDGQAAASTSGGTDLSSISDLNVTDGSSGLNKANEAIFNSKIAFPLNLTRMLEAVDAMKKSHIIHWGEDGLSFIICDIDAFLADVLPKFFKSSENTKIRSFYRKLNRWGFSMSRKNANNPNNVWHHPDFHRTSAVEALKQALETGKATDFLNMSSISRGKKRRGTDSSKDGVDADMLGQEDDDAHTHTTLDASSVRDFSDSDFTSTLLPSLSRTSLQSNGSWMGGLPENSATMGSAASMPILPSSERSMENLNKRWKLGHHSFTANRPSMNNNARRGRRVLSHHSGHASTAGLRRTQSMAPTAGNVGMGSNGWGSSNATFETIGEGSVNATFDLSALSRPSPSSGLSRPSLNGSVMQDNPLAAIGEGNAQFDLSALSRRSPRNSVMQDNPLAAIGEGNAQFDLSALSRPSLNGNAMQGLNGNNAMQGLNGNNAMQGLNGNNAMQGLNSNNAMQGLNGNAVQGNPLSSMMASSLSIGTNSNSNKPRPNVFALSAQQMLNTNGINNAQSGNEPFGQNNVSINNNNNGNNSNGNPFRRSSLDAGSGTSNPFRRPASANGGAMSMMNANMNMNMNIAGRTPPLAGAGLLQNTSRPRRGFQQELSRQEDNELTSFLGSFAVTLPPPREDDEEEVGEPDPIRY